MSTSSIGTRALAVVFTLVGLVILAVELTVNRGRDGSFLVVLTVWAGIVEGCIALAAVGEIARGRWLRPIKRELLSAYPMLLFIALLFLIVGTKMGMYPWNEARTAWMTPGFFVGRNFVVLLLTFGMARLLANAVMKGSEKKNTYAVIYVALFVTSQSMVAFDWVMSLEYPWVSTLFGGYFFIESFLLGIIAGGFIVYFKQRAGDGGLTETLRDTSKMMFSFCFMWGGFFFAQYLVIWYGNIPEEVAYVLKRVDPSPYWGLSRAVLMMVFVIPFVTLLSRQVKTVAPAVVAIGTIVLIGQTLEKIIMVAPVVPVSKLWIPVEMALMTAAFAILIVNRESFMNKQVAESAMEGGHAGDAADLVSAPPS